MKLKDNPKINTLIKTLASIDNEELMLAFMEDLSTVKELLDLAERFYVASLLYEKQTYESISQKTKMSTATIARVNRSLLYGTGGYERILSKKQD